MTGHISACPDAEAKRLHQIVSELPINADGPWYGITERLPRQISRHLFPDKPERKTRRLLDDVISDFAEEFLPPHPKQSATRPQARPSIDVKSEKLWGSFASASSPHTAKTVPKPRSTADPTPWSQSAPTHLGRTYSIDRSRRPSLVDTGRHNTAPALPPPPLPCSSPVDLYRRSVGDLARADLPLPGSPTEREEGGKQYVPTRADYTLKSVAVNRATPRRIAVAQAGSGNPGPTWDEYLGGRLTAGTRERVSARGQKASI